jgi:hypothetical protein
MMFEWLSLAGMILGCFLFLHNQIDSLDQKMERSISQQSVRTDRLYEMFIDLLKEKK